MQSPRKSGKTLKSALATPVQVKEQLTEYIKRAKELDKLAKEVSKKKAVLADHVKRELGDSKGNVTVTDINKLKTRNYELIRKVSSLYRKAYQRVKADRVGSINGGFRQPVLVGDDLTNFFRQADLGRVGGRLDNSGQPLQNILPFITADTAGERYATRSILTSLFALYAKKHNLTSLARDNQGKPADQVNHQLLGVDQLMNNSLNGLLSQVEQRSAAKLALEGKADGQPKPATTPSGKPRKYYRDDARTLPNWNDFEHAFNRNNFSYSSLQSIFSLGIDTTSLTMFTDPATGERVQDKLRSLYFVHDPALARAYMEQLEAAKRTPLAGDSKSSVLGTAGNTPNDFVARAFNAVPLPERDPNRQALLLAAALDQVHLTIQGASATYTVVRAKKASKKPRRAAGAVSR